MPQWKVGLQPPPDACPGHLRAPAANAGATSGNTGNSTPAGSPGKRKQTLQVGLRAKRAKPGAAASDLQPPADDGEVMGETEPESLFGLAQDKF